MSTKTGAVVKHEDTVPSALSGMELLTAQEVAAALRVGRSTIYELDRTGALRAVVVSSGPERACRRWLAVDVRAYIEQQRGQAPGHVPTRVGSDQGHFRSGSRHRRR